MDRAQLVIVALPSESDQVRTFSSEKEPHLTLLYLGKNNFDQAQIDHIEEYVEHASSQLARFTLGVESRGNLGDDNADVIFFETNWRTDNITRFRDLLLQDPLISTAYNSVDQFPEWTPHLTMGYPDTPAKKGGEHYSDFGYVDFDRIALWTGDSTGPTFRLKPYRYDTEVAMSQLQTPRPDVVTGILQHYGVKGMKWGVRRSQSQLDSSSGGAISDDVKAFDSAQAKIAQGGTRAVSNKELQSVLERMNLESRYSAMMEGPPSKSSMDRGHDNVKKALAMGATVESVRRFMQTPTGKAVKTGLAGAFAAAAAGATGGTSAAAAAGASVVIRRTANHYTNDPR